jgi:hypothetical protein
MVPLIIAALMLTAAATSSYYIDFFVKKVEIERAQNITRDVLAIVEGIQQAYGHFLRLRGEGKYNEACTYWETFCNDCDGKKIGEGTPLDSYSIFYDVPWVESIECESAILKKENVQRNGVLFNDIPSLTEFRLSVTTSERIYPKTVYDSSVTLMRTAYVTKVDFERHSTKKMVVHMRLGAMTGSQTPLIVF